MAADPRCSDDIARARRERAWLALSDLFRGTTPDFAGIAKSLRGFSLDEIRGILFDEVAPVCAVNLMGEGPPSLPLPRGEELVRLIRGRTARGSSFFGKARVRLRAGYLRLYCNELWRATAERIPACWRQTRLTPPKIAALAHKAMLLEVGASPKPGLVSPDHNGAHKDMDYPLLVASADALLPHFELCAATGMEFAADAPEDVFARLRALGLVAEKAMFAATGGVNTHKGLFFSLGLMCAAGGRLLRNQRPLWPGNVAREAASFVKGIVAKDLAPLKNARDDQSLTAGERLYVTRGVGGVRREAEEGFPCALAAFERLYYLYGDLPPEKALPQTLLWLMSVTEDTNVLSRGGEGALAFIRGDAAAILALGGMYTPEGQRAVLALREACVARNISPGGSADLLALAIFFRLLQDAE